MRACETLRVCSWCEGEIGHAPFHLPGLPGIQCWLHFLVSSMNRERPGKAEVSWVLLVTAGTILSVNAQSVLVD